MCKCLPRENQKVLGILFTIFVFAISIPCIALSGVDFYITHMDWTTMEPWNKTGALKVGCVVVVFITNIIGFATFTRFHNSVKSQRAFIFFNTASTILTLAVSVIALCAGSMKVNEPTLECKAKTGGIFDHFNSLDAYFKYVDLNLCATLEKNNTECLCRFTNYTAIDDFLYHADFYNEYKRYKFTEDKKLGAIQIQNCPLAIEEAIAEINKDSRITTDIGSQDLDSFAKFAAYWGRIEERFKCTGWCSNSYTISGEGKEEKDRHYLHKYMFSDINYGPVRQTCMKPVIKWVSKTLLAFGTLTLVIFILQCILWILTFSLLRDYTKDAVKREKKEYKNQYKIKPRSSKSRSSNNDSDENSNNISIANSNDKSNSISNDYNEEDEEDEEDSKIVNLLE